MRKILSAALILAGIVSVKTVHAQAPSAGTISYDMETVAKMNMNGQDYEQKMSMSMNLHFSGENYRMTATLQSGGMASGVGINISDAPKMYQYYSPQEKILYQLNTVKGKHFAIRTEPKKISDVQPTGKKETILGYACEEFTCSYNGEPATGWYTAGLPAFISPIGNIGLPGTLLKFESKGYKYKATAIQTGAAVSEAELKLPKDAVKTTREGFMKEMQNIQ